MAQVITLAGEKLFATKAQANQQLDIDTFIFANVAGQDPAAAIDRNEGIPTNAIVHQQNVQQTGRINDNVVVYSTVLDSVTGPFEFNWVGLYSSVNQTLVAISHVPTVSKTITAPGSAGNTLNRNFGIEYSGIADLAGISVSPETWQLDFSARLSGMDELTRQLASDMNGKDWFIDDGFKVVPRSTANTFSVTPGVGYVSGLRVELKQEHILTIQTYPQFVYVDAYFDGDASSTWAAKNNVIITSDELTNYVDGTGKQHYLFKIAIVTAADQVEDLRLKGSIKKHIHATTHINSLATVFELINCDELLLKEGAKIRTSFYNTQVTCDWTLTKLPTINSYNIAINTGSGWYAQLTPLLGTMLTPQMVGAFGDLSQEDHIAVQTCLDYFENNKFYGEVIVNKDYLVGDTIKGRSYASMTGLGLFKAKDGLNKTVIDIYAAYPTRKIQNVVYEGFRIDGNAVNQAATVDNLLGAGFALRCDVVNPGVNGDVTLHTGELENITVNRVNSYNCKINGFYFGKNTFVGRGYTHNQIKASFNVNGIFLDDLFEYTDFTGAILQENQFGVRDNGSSNIGFIGGMSNNNTEAGFYLEKTGRNTSKKKINGMHINHNKRGIWIGTGQGTIGVRHDQLIITNSNIMANMRQGIVATGGDKAIVKNNVFSGNGSESPGAYDDIDLANNCREWDIDNIHFNSTGETRFAVHFDNSGPFGKNTHNYHKIDGSFTGYVNPIGVDFANDPSVQPNNANTNFIQGIFEYYAPVETPPSGATGNAEVDISKIPLGTICINNIDSSGLEQWLAIKPPSSAGSGTSVIFKRV